MKRTVRVESSLSLNHRGLADQFDIDIVFYRNAIVNTPELQIPHPRYQDRAFVLGPLSDLIPTGVAHRPPRVYCQSIENSSPSRA